jgi:hypothetical protein
LSIEKISDFQKKILTGCLATFQTFIACAILYKWKKENPGNTDDVTREGITKLYL